jgi:hypothetical protein
MHQFNDLSSPAFYTSQIRHRHYSVGSYYDHKNTSSLHPHRTLYLLGSAPVSPLSRASTTSSESHYHVHHHSPLSSDNISLNALRRVNPFLESNIHPSSISNYDYKRPSSLHRDESNRTTTITYTSPRMTSRSVDRTIPVS